MHKILKRVHNNFMIVFVIKEIREKKNISLYKLSQMTGISRTYLRELENNKKSNPSMSILRNISNTLGVNIKKLFYSELDIQYLKNVMNEKINAFGLDSTEVLEVSQVLDILINLEMNGEG